MVSIIPRVDLLGNTVVDWICKLSYFRLDTLYVGWEQGADCFFKVYANFCIIARESYTKKIHNSRVLISVISLLSVHTHAECYNNYPYVV